MLRIDSQDVECENSFVLFVENIIKENKMMSIIKLHGNPISLTLSQVTLEFII